MNTTDLTSRTTVQKILQYSFIIFSLKTSTSIDSELQKESLMESFRDVNHLNPYDSHLYSSYWVLLADVSALHSQYNWRVNVISWLDYDWQTEMSGTHLIFISLARERCWHAGFCKWATDTFLIVFCLIRVGLDRSGAADNGKLQTFLIDLQSFDFRENSNPLTLTQSFVSTSEENHVDEGEEG